MNPISLTRLLGVREVDQAAPKARADHVIIVGFGVAGGETAAALRRLGADYLVLELNAETVREAQRNGEPVHYADATSSEVLAHAAVQRAAAVVVSINDPGAGLRVVDSVHRAAPEVPVLIRTRYLGDRESLAGAGAAEIVAEEVEASVEITGRLLRRRDVPGNVIDAEIEQTRRALQTSQRGIAAPRPSAAGVRALSDLKVDLVLHLARPCLDLTTVGASDADKGRARGDGAEDGTHGGTITPP